MQQNPKTIMSLITIKEKMQILELFDDGISMTKHNDKGIIPKLYFLKDKSLNGFEFIKNQIINITLQDTDMIKEEIITEDKIILYCVVNALCSSGFYTKYYDSDKGIFFREFWYNEKGLLTLPTLRKGNPFEIGDFIKIEIKC